MRIIMLNRRLPSVGNWIRFKKIKQAGFKIWIGTYELKIYFN